MPQLLLVAAYFYPTDTVGAHRPGRWVNYLADFGWTTSVLSLDTRDRFPVDETLLRHIPDSAHITRVPSHDVAMRLARTSRFLRRGAGPRAKPSRDSRPPFPAALPRAGTQRVLDWIGFADAECFDWPRLWRAARGLSEPVDCMMVSAPPFSMIPLAARLARKAQRPLVIDYRDPWTPDRSRVYASALHHRLQKRVEARCVAHASAVLVTNEPARDAYLNAFPDLAPESVHVIPNGFDPDEYMDLPGPAPGPPYRVGHFGTLHGGRDPGPLLREAAALVTEKRLGAEDIEFHFFGARFNVDLEPQRSSGVFLYPPLSREQFIAEMGRCHVLLLVASPRHGLTIPAKLYEYVGANRPVLGLCPPGAAAEWMREADLGRVCEPQDRAQIADSLLSIAAPGGRDFARLTPEARARLERREQTRSLAEVLKQVTSKTSRS